MTLEIVVLVVTALAVLALLYVRGLAGRLDRLHLRVDAATAALETKLVQRAGLARELALGGWLDPASALLLLDASQAAENLAPGGQGPSGDGMARDLAQSDLTAALRAVLDEPETIATVQSDAAGRELLVELADVSQGVVLARRFANDAVQAAVAVRRRWLVRSLHLAGRASWPITREMDDAPPASLAEFTLRAA